MLKLRSVLVAVLLIVSVSLLSVWGSGVLDRSSALSTTRSNPVISSTVGDSSPPYVDEIVGTQLSTQELVQQVGPAVVSITTETTAYDWFLQPVPQTGAGTGVIIAPDGYIVTNNHVVEGAQNISCTILVFVDDQVPK